MGVDKPNYTQIPNMLLDDLMMHMQEAELKVTLAIARQTFGYHRDKHGLSLTDLQQLTGLSRQGVINGINAGLERGTIERDSSTRSGFIYSLSINGDTISTSQPNVLVNEVDQETSQPNGLELVNEVDRSSQRSRPPLVNEVDQNTPVLKKELKKDRKKELKKGAASQPAPAAPPSLGADVEFSEKPTAPEPKKLTPQQEMYGAICEALGWDYKIITDRNKVQVAQAVKILSRANYTVDDIRRFMVEIWFNDWRWEKHGSYPTLTQLREEIGKIRSAVPTVAPPKKKTNLDKFREIARSQEVAT